MSQLLFSLYLQVTYITKLSMNVWSFSLQQGCQDHSTEKGQSLQEMVLGKLDIHKQKNELDFYTIHKKSKWIQDLNIRIK